MSTSPPAHHLPDPSPTYDAASLAAAFAHFNHLSTSHNRSKTFFPLFALLSVSTLLTLILHLSYSLLVSYLISRTSFPSPPFSLPTAVLSPTSMSLFILLAFTLSESTTRHAQFLERLHALQHTLRHIARKLALDYPPSTWHACDRPRLFAHLAAYPLALLHSLQHPDAPSLAPLLHPRDLRSTLAAPSPHRHLTTTLRAYFAAAEDDSPLNFPSVAATRTPPGAGTRFHIITLVDTLDAHADTVLRLARFRPARPYRNHLRIFVILWSMFLPLALAPDTRWFTPLWTTLATYAVGTVLALSVALDRPLASVMAAEHVKRLCSRFAADVLADARIAPSYASTIRESRDTPQWLSVPLPAGTTGYSIVPPFAHRSRWATLRAALYPSRRVFLPLVIFTAWSAVIVFLTYALSQRLDTPRADGDRWWSVQVPLTNTALGYFTMSMLLLLSFWTTHAFARVFRAIRLWTVSVRINVEYVARVATHVLRPGLWHVGDRERLLAHLAALPLAMKLHLRAERSVEQLNELLSADDVEAFASDPRPYPVHCMDVLLSYVDSADAVEDGIVCDTERPFLSTAFGLQTALWNADRALWESVALNEAAIPAALTLHLKVFVAIWLALLPTVVVQHAGFVSFIFLIPIAFSVVNLVHVADRIRHPFHCEDNVIPLDDFCREIRDSVHRTYLETCHGTRGVIPTNECYARADFYASTAAPISHEKRDRTHNALARSPVALVMSWMQLFMGNSLSPLSADDLPVVREHYQRLTVRDTVRQRLRRFPAISLTSYVAVTLWAVAAVYLSWGLSTLWEGEDRGPCRQWCSPIDVEGAVLANAGFALFLIMSFRASDALQRFDNGAAMLHELALRARGLALEFAHIFPSGFFHPGDKERVVAHVAQIPLCLRDMLRSSGNAGRVSVDDGLLSPADRQRFVSSPSPIDYLIETVESYILLQDSTKREGWDIANFRALPFISGPLLGHVTALRAVIAQTTTLKRFAVVASYRRLERVFSTIWLILLPLSMAPDLGFFTILWGPLVSYGVLVLQDFADQLADPFGCDPGDLPLDALCARASDGVLDAVLNAGWDTNRLCAAPLDMVPVAESVTIGATMCGARVRARLIPPRLSVVPDARNYTESWSALSTSQPFTLRGPRRTRPSFLAHVLCSTPWRAVFATFLWAIAACTVQAVTRANKREGEGGWWASTVAITISVVNGASFGAFLLLGFFAAAAFARYDRGGSLWEARVRPACHQLSSALLIYVRNGIVHTEDSRRLIGLVASIPLLLKAELRGVRDLRDVAGLLTPQDLIRISCAESMVMYCLDAVRAYILRIVNQMELLLHKEVAHPRARTAFVRSAIVVLEGALQEARLLNTFSISPVFRVLLKTLLGIFFAIVPFILFELSGWFTLLWTPMIAYGLMGTYAVAFELQQPFRGDLNGVDIDEISQSTVEDILKVYEEQKEYFTLLNNFVDPPRTWTAKRLKDVDCSDQPSMHQSRPRWQQLWRSVRLATLAVRAWQLFGLAVWSTLVVALAFVLARRLDLERCQGQNFCQFAIIDENIKDFIGFAVFFLLGFRVNDAHRRFATAQILWQENILGTAHRLTNRLLQSFAPGSFHPGDVDRMCGHVAAMPIALAADLRATEGLMEDLKRVVGEEDARRICASRERAARCLDVVRAYLFYSETLDVTHPERDGIADEERFNCLIYVDELQAAGYECRRIARVTAPFGYALHVRIFVVVWLLLLPIGLVESAGWLTILWVVLVGYGLLGTLRWAEQLAEPFGCDEADVPLYEFRDEVVRAVENNLPQFRQGAATFVEEGKDVEASIRGKG